MGLFIGMSIITVFELLDFLIFTCLGTRCQRKQQQSRL